MLSNQWKGTKTLGRRMNPLLEHSVDQLLERIASVGQVSRESLETWKPRIAAPPKLVKETHPVYQDKDGEQYILLGEVGDSSHYAVKLSQVTKI